MIPMQLGQLRMHRLAHPNRHQLIPLSREMQAIIQILGQPIPLSSLINPPPSVHHGHLGLFAHFLHGYGKESRTFGVAIGDARGITREEVGGARFGVHGGRGDEEEFCAWRVVRGGGGTDEQDEFVQVGFELLEGELEVFRRRARGGQPREKLGRERGGTNGLRGRRERSVVCSEPNDEEGRFGEGVGRLG